MTLLHSVPFRRRSIRLVGVFLTTYLSVLNCQTSPSIAAVNTRLMVIVRKSKKKKEWEPEYMFIGCSAYKRKEP